MKNLLSLTLLGFLFFFGSQAFAQDYSGRYRLVSDTEIDGRYTAQFTGNVYLEYNGDDVYEGTNGDRDLTISIVKSGKKTVFVSLDEGGGYVSCGTGNVINGVFKGLFVDNNGTRGEFKMTPK